MDYTILGTTGGSQNPADSMLLDHVTLVIMKGKPVVNHLQMEGILDEMGKVLVPLNEKIEKVNQY